MSHFQDVEVEVEEEVNGVVRGGEVEVGEVGTEIEAQEPRDSLLISDGFLMIDDDNDVLEVEVEEDEEGDEDESEEASTGDVQESRLFLSKVRKEEEEEGTGV